MLAAARTPHPPLSTVIACIRAGEGLCGGLLQDIWLASASFAIRDLKIDRPGAEAKPS